MATTRKVWKDPDGVQHDSLPSSYTYTLPNGKKATCWPFTEAKAKSYGWTLVEVPASGSSSGIVDVSSDHHGHKLDIVYAGADPDIPSRTRLVITDTSQFDYETKKKYYSSEPNRSDFPEGPEGTDTYNMAMTEYQWGGQWSTSYKVAKYDSTLEPSFNQAAGYAVNPKNGGLIRLPRDLSWVPTPANGASSQYDVYVSMDYQSADGDGTHTYSFVPHGGEPPQHQYTAPICTVTVTADEDGNVTVVQDDLTGGQPVKMNENQETARANGPAGCTAKKVRDEETGKEKQSVEVNGHNAINQETGETNAVPKQELDCSNPDEIPKDANGVGYIVEQQPPLSDPDDNGTGKPEVGWANDFELEHLADQTVLADVTFDEEGNIVDIENRAPLDSKNNLSYVPYRTRASRRIAKYNYAAYFADRYVLINPMSLRGRYHDESRVYSGTSERKTYRVDLDEIENFPRRKTDPQFSRVVEFVAYILVQNGVDAPEVGLLRDSEYKSLATSVANRDDCYLVKLSACQAKYGLFFPDSTIAYFNKQDIIDADIYDGQFSISTTSAPGKAVKSFKVSAGKVYLKSNGQYVGEPFSLPETTASMTSGSRAIAVRPKAYDGDGEYQYGFELDTDFDAGVFRRSDSFYGDYCVSIGELNSDGEDDDVGTYPNKKVIEQKYRPNKSASPGTSIELSGTHLPGTPFSVFPTSEKRIVIDGVQFRKYSSDWNATPQQLPQKSFEFDDEASSTHYLMLCAYPDENHTMDNATFRLEDLSTNRIGDNAVALVATVKTQVKDGRCYISSVSMNHSDTISLDLSRPSDLPFTASPTDPMQENWYFRGGQYTLTPFLGACTVEDVPSFRPNSYDYKGDIVACVVPDYADGALRAAFEFVKPGHPVLSWQTVKEIGVFSYNAATSRYKFTPYYNRTGNQISIDLSPGANPIGYSHDGSTTFYVDGLQLRSYHGTTAGEYQPLALPDSMKILVASSQDVAQASQDAQNAGIINGVLHVCYDLSQKAFVKFKERTPDIPGLLYRVFDLTLTTADRLKPSDEGQQESQPESDTEVVAKKPANQATTLPVPEFLESFRVRQTDYRLGVCQMNSGIFTVGSKSVFVPAQTFQVTTPGTYFVMCRITSANGSLSSALVVSTALDEETADMGTKTVLIATIKVTTNPLLSDFIHCEISQKRSGDIPVDGIGIDY